MNLNELTDSFHVSKAANGIPLVWCMVYIMVWLVCPKKASSRKIYTKITYI